MQIPQGRRVITGVLFSDPGTTYDAFALMVALDDAAVVVVDAWYGEFDEARLASGLATLRALCPDRALFAIETIEGGIYGKGKTKRRARDIFATKSAEERLRLIAKQRGWTATPLAHLREPPYPPLPAAALLDISAPRVRTTLLGKPFPCNVDRQLGWVIPAWFTDRATGRLELPAMTATQAPHIHDAVAGGLVVLCMVLARPGGPLPEDLATALRRRLAVPGGLLRFASPRIWQGLVRIQMEEEAKSRAKRFAEQNGLKLPPKPRRSPPRAVAKAGLEKRAATLAQKRAARG